MHGVGAVKVMHHLIFNLRTLPHALSYSLQFSTLPLIKKLDRAKTKKKSRFVFVVSFPRSGTTALGSLLKQPEAQVNYHGEFFALNHWSSSMAELTKRYPFFSYRYKREFSAQKKSWKYYRFEEARLNPALTFDALKDIPGVHVFKIFPFHLYDKSLMDAIEIYKPDIMFLRRNHLDRLVSHKKAMATGVWHGVSTDEVEVDIPEEQLNKYIKDYETFYSLMHQKAISSGCSIIDIEYEHLFEEATIKKVLEFIVGSADKVSQMNVVPRTLKQGTQDASQQAFLKKLAEKGVQKSVEDFDFHRIGQ